MRKSFAVQGLIIALAVSIAAIGCDSGSDGGNNSLPPTKTATPTLQPTQQPTSTTTNTQNQAATATSLDFTIEVVYEGAGTSTYRYRARNIGTSNLDIRIDGDVYGAGEVCYILSRSAQNGWIYTEDQGEGQWVSYADSGYTDFNLFCDDWSAGFSGLHQSLIEAWTGLQNWTYTIPEMGTVTYTNIKINPSLPDSVFQPN